jgi:predicted short-subunit dehydrogenase-like oxidoreductase (DUF2520 family)
MLRVSIIGPGRVGRALALSLPGGKYREAQLLGRGETPTEPVDIVFITTPDTEILAAARSLAGKVMGAPKVFHTSGSQPSSIMEPLRADGCSIGSIHPLVSISSPELGPERFPGAFFCVEGDPAAVEVGRRIVADLGGRSFTIGTQSKTLYHAAAVTACGHLVALFDAAIEMMTKCGLSHSESKEILLPLLVSTVRNLETQDTAAALTGTFARADSDTFTRHITALNEHSSEELLEIYLLLGQRSLELAARQGVSPERIEKLRAKVAIAKSKLKW